MYSFLVDESSEHRKWMGVNKNVVATTSHDEYKGVLFNKICLRHLVNMIQSKDRRTGTFEINNVSLSLFDNQINILSNGYNGLALDC